MYYLCSVIGPELHEELWCCQCSEPTKCLQGGPSGRGEVLFSMVKQMYYWCQQMHILVSGPHNFSRTSLTSFCHLSLSTHVTIVTGWNVEGASKGGVGVSEGEGVRHCSVHMWVTLSHPHLHKFLHHLQSYCGYGEAYRMQGRRDCAAGVKPNRQQAPEQQPGLHQPIPPRPGVLLTQ